MATGASAVPFAVVTPLWETFSVPQAGTPANTKPSPADLTSRWMASAVASPFSSALLPPIPVRRLAS
jgi:hypothetical protein